MWTEMSELKKKWHDTCITVYVLFSMYDFSHYEYLSIKADSLTDDIDLVC